MKYVYKKYWLATKYQGHKKGWGLMCIDKVDAHENTLCTRYKHTHVLDINTHYVLDINGF